jgi:DNA helicase IV
MSRESELLSDQAHFDRAAQRRDERISDAASGISAGADREAMRRLRDHLEELRRLMGNAADAVAFGRADSDGVRLYIGRHLIRDGYGEPLVISWQAPAAAKFYRATPADPMGVTRKRTYDCDGNIIKDFADVLFGLGLEPQRFDEFLQRVLSRGRTGSMRDIVATIQAAQYDVIQAPIDQVLVIEGGPGTGKTAIALHRVSWMLAQADTRLSPQDVLVVGPSATFTRYIRNVLPVLGDSEVPVRHIGQLAPEVTHVGRAEEDRTAALKGDARMAGVLVRALESRVGTPEPVERLPGDVGFTSVPGVDIAAIITDCRERPLSYNERRAMFRERLGGLVAQRGRVRAQALANLVDRLWPPQSAAAFLHGLLGSRRRLEAAGVPELSAEEMMLLFRQGNARVAEEVWSAGDLHLLDELQHLIDGDTPTYRHIVVDEVQDLSPMQLRSVARRSATGALTVVGDIAQSTGWWARDDWADVTRHLPAKLPVTVDRLRYGYRVPRPAYEFAARLLPVAAPTTVAAAMVSA